WFADVFDRFCTSSSARDPDFIRNTATDLFSQDFSPFSSATSQNDVADKNDEKPSDINDVAAVADENRGEATKRDTQGPKTHVRTKVRRDEIRGTSSDPVYTGPVVAVPDLGPDPLDEYGQPQPTNGSADGGLTQERRAELADWWQKWIADGEKPEDV